MEQPAILIIDDDAALCESIAETVADSGMRPLIAPTGRLGLARLRAEPVDGVLVDMRLGGDMDGLAVLRSIRALDSPPPTAVLTAYATAENTIEAMRLGAIDHLTKPIGRDDLLDLLKRMTAASRAAASPATAPVAPPPEATLIGRSPAVREVHKIIGLSADSKATALIQGETGSGKELVARALHTFGARKAHAFVAVNCAAIPADLLESELFGHIKGAFTGATADREGAFRQADKGTLFLDEIGDMPLAMQAKILRVLQDGTVTPVGGKPVKTDVRIVAATHQPLASLVEQGAFRRDLFYRLNVIQISLPPLRDRVDDIEPLAQHFLARAAQDGRPKHLTAAAMAKLRAHSWPGNVRELRNVLERACVMVRGDAIGPDELVFAQEAGVETPAGDDWLSGDLPGAVARLEREMIRRALQATNGNRTEAARRLNVNRQLLYTKMQKYGFAAESENTTPAVVKADGEQLA